MVTFLELFVSSSMSSFVVVDVTAVMSFFVSLFVAFPVDGEEDVIG